MKSSLIIALIIMNLILVLVSQQTKAEKSKSNTKTDKSKTNKQKELPKLVEICDEPVIINSVNRFRNSTIRLYRDDTSWNLMGLPDKQGFTTDKTKISIANMAPINRGATIVSALESPKNLTYKFEKQYFWSWDEDGTQVSGGRGGEHWKDLPKGGFTTVFHNGNKTKPMFIGFKKNKVYYISTKENDFDFVGNSDGHIGGKFGENFPVGITSAFSWPMTDTQTMVYLFKDDKYCLRDINPLPSGKDCDEWRETRELFGCIKVAKFAITDTSSDVPTSVVTNSDSTTSPVPSSDSGTASSTSIVSETSSPNVGPVNVDTSAQPSSKPNTGARIQNSEFVSILAYTSILFIIIFKSL